MITRALFCGFLGAIALLFLYAGIVTLLSGWEFALNQFLAFWYFIISLAAGFGIQISLYVYLRSAIQERNASGGVVAVSGTASAIAMLSCCTHYLANILPILGIAGFVSIVSQYQIELFWVGLAFNFAGIIYIVRKIILFRRIHA